MTGTQTFAPVRNRRFFFIFFVLAAARLIAAPSMSPRPDLSQSGKPDPAEAARLLEQFRQSGIPGEYYAEFELRSLPRRGEERVFTGRMWGGRNKQGAITRVEIADAAGGVQRLLVQNGERPAVWQVDGGQVGRMKDEREFEPIVPGVGVSAFNLQMPYLYWPGATIESIKRVLGRPAHVFRFTAPPGSAAEKAGITTAKVYLDTQFNQLLKTELMNAAGRLVETVSLVSLKTVDRQTVPKAIDFLDGVSRDKTRLQLRRIALHLDLAPTVFEPRSLAEVIQPPAPERLVSLD